MSTTYHKWSAITNANQDMVIGNKYMVTLWFASPESFRAKAEVAIKGASSIINKLKQEHIDTYNGIEIVDVYSEPAVMSARQGAVDPWPLRVIFIKRSGGTGIVVVAALIIALLLAAAFFLKYTKREFHQAVQDTTNLAKETVFNPGFILAALVAAAIIFRK